jgi:hypothetical protein
MAILLSDETGVGYTQMMEQKFPPALKPAQIASAILTTAMPARITTMLVWDTSRGRKTLVAVTG